MSLLLDVRVKRIERDADARIVSHGVAKRDGVGGRIQEIGLEPIQRLDREGHAVLDQGRARAA